MYSMITAIITKSPTIGRTFSRMIVVNQMRNYSSGVKLEDQFNDALSNLKKLKDEPDNTVKLKLYGLYKQSTVGECTVAKPSLFNVVEKAKWDAWASLGKLPSSDAMQQYIVIVNEMLKDSNIAANGSSTVEPSVADESSKQAEVLVENNDGVCWIKYNRPKKFNAINIEMFDLLPKALVNAANDDSIKLAVVTGCGDYYSSGNDLSNFMEITKQHKDDLRAGVIAGSKILQKFVASFIDFPKPIIGAVNGPALGIAATTLALMDCVVASDKAWFQTPFSSLGQSPEACSTVTFPAIMGYSLASEMLYFNYKLSAEEAARRGFVSRVIPSDKFNNYLQEWLYGDKGIVKTCFPKSMMISKGLVRTEEMRMKLHQINKEECETLAERWLSDECAQAIQQFFTRKSNL